MTLYSSGAVDNLIARYIDMGGYIHQIEEGCLGHGFLIMEGEGLKTIVVKEVYINEWSSGHKVRKYNEVPKKYLEMIESL